ncbi:MAG TPA: hypothetical protein VHX88_20935, partial [Solirubrobacteraceae bacterium]|nr:hypothetical protein [Solirubrobacteraceae bacterium]
GVERPAAVLVREEPLPRNADGKLVRRRLAMWARRWLPRLTESGPIPVRSVPEPARPPGRSRVARDDA